jgi:hypothetical protein
LQTNEDGCVDEIKQYYDYRYLSPSESVWRIFKFDIHRRWPAVNRLTFHLEGKQKLIFKDSSKLTNVLKYNEKLGTMFLAWMDANKKYPQGRHLTYSQFPTMFTFNSRHRRWRLRKSGTSVGQLTFFSPSSREIYYLRLLLNVQVGCTSFEDIRTIDGVVYDTFREACDALRLLEDDLEFINGLKEVALLGSGFILRKVFAKMLLANSMSDPLNVWNQMWETLADGLLYDRRIVLKSPGDIV